MALQRHGAYTKVCVVSDLRDNTPLLRYLKQKHDDWVWGIKRYGDPYNREIIRLVIIGWMERKPFDLSDLALGLYVSRQQVMRRVVTLRKAGVVWAARVRNRVLVHPTELLVEQTRMAIYEVAAPLALRTRQLMENICECEPRRGRNARQDKEPQTSAANGREAGTLRAMEGVRREGAKAPGIRSATKLGT